MIDYQVDQNSVAHRLGLTDGELYTLLWAAKTPREFKNIMLAVETLKLRGILGCDGGLTAEGRELFGRSVELSAEQSGNHVLATAASYPW